VAQKTKTKKVAKKTLVKKLATKVFSLLEMSVELAVEENKEGVIINVKMENPALLIGFHGETLSSLQLVLSMMVYRELKEWVRLAIDVDGYLQRRQEVLEQMALSTAQRVRFSQEAYVLPPMNSRERRIVHLALVGITDVQTESQGEEPQRSVVVNPASKK